MKNPTRAATSASSADASFPRCLIAALDELERAIDEAFADPAFWDEYHAVLRDFVGRPSPLYRCERYAADVSAVPLLMKREDTNHTGAHKINNTVGQALLARRMGKRRLIAETGAGQHGVATATVGAKFGLPVDVYMGARDVERQALNVDVMRLLGATVHAVTSGTQTLKDATNEAFRVWAERVDDTFYVIGSVVGAHPYPYLVRELQKSHRHRGAPPSARALRPAAERRRRLRRRRQQRDRDLRRVRSTIRRCGSGASRRPAKASTSGRPPRRLARGASASCTARVRICCRATRARCARRTRSAAGLDYPGVGPEHAFLKESGRATYVSVTDAEAIDAFHAVRAQRGHRSRARERARDRVRAQARRASAAPTI